MDQRLDPNQPSSRRRPIALASIEPIVFTIVLVGCVVGLLRHSLIGGRVLSSADLVHAQRGWSESGVEPANRLLMDPFLQFEPWLELSRRAIREGRLPVWNPLAGCGAPLFANGQSAVLDPFHVIAYLGAWPGSLAWIGAARLVVAGLGMFVLAGTWGFGRLGRWYAGLAYPFTGFLICWLLFPLSSVAAWLPWLLTCVECVRRRPSLLAGLGLALVVAFVLLGGHIQTSAHVLIAAALLGLGAHPRGPAGRRFAIVSIASTVLGIGLAAPAILPLGDYLSRSPTWQDRRAEFQEATAFRPIRWREAACWAVPYVYGSQRAGHPNLARALGVENLNESAGGFAGTITLFWLAPLGAWAGRRSPVTRYLTVLTVLGTLASLRVPPIDNLLRLAPILNVMDHRRLTLWVAFGLVGLGAIGLDRLEARPPRRWALVWILAWTLGALSLIAAAFSLPLLEGTIRERVSGHYDSLGGSLSREEIGSRVDRQSAAFLDFLPTYYARVGGTIALASALGTLWLVRRSRRVGLGVVLAGITLIDLFGFADGLNPSISREDFRPGSPLIVHLRSGLGRTERAIGIGDELPANLLTRYGISDVRNYDSIELSANLDAFEALYEPEPDRPARSSRRTITWEGVGRARSILRRSGVRAVVGRSEPPPGLFDRVESVGELRVGWWNRTIEEPPEVGVDGRFWLTLDPAQVNTLVVVPVTYEPGWTASCNGLARRVVQAGPFLGLEPRPGDGRVRFDYRPGSLRSGKIAGAVALGIWLLGATLVARKIISKPLGVVSRVGLESNIATRRTRLTRPALSSGGRGADGPLQV